MKKPPVSLLSSARAVDAYQELAVAVIRQALLDAGNPDESESVRVGAQTFLAGSPMLRQWCGVAGLDPNLVRARYLKRVRPLSHAMNRILLRATLSPRQARAQTWARR